MIMIIIVLEEIPISFKLSTKCHPNPFTCQTHFVLKERRWREEHQEDIKEKGREPN